MKNFKFLSVLILAVIFVPRAQADSVDKAIERSEAAISSMGFTVLDKRLYDHMDECKKSIDLIITEARAANPNVDVIDLKPHMKLQGHYSFAIATSREDFIAHYCLPAGDTKAAYIKAKAA